MSLFKFICAILSFAANNFKHLRRHYYKHLSFFAIRSEKIKFFKNIMIDKVHSDFEYILAFSRIKKSKVFRQ